MLIVNWASANRLVNLQTPPEGSVIFAQLGVLTNLEAALTHGQRGPIAWSVVRGVRVAAKH
jgi:hypothetical protein